MRENRSLQERVDARTNVIVRRFDLIQILLRELGYLDGETITPHGRLLAKIYSETDLLVAEMVRNGDFDGLTAQELVSVISALVFEARKDESPKIPQGRISEVLKTMVMRWSDINDRELELHLEEMRQPDLGFAFIALRWAQGNSLSSVLKGTEITVGDFIRTMKQIVDLLRQIGNASPDMKDICELALNKIDRGIITYAGVVG